MLTKVNGINRRNFQKKFGKKEDKDMNKSSRNSVSYGQSKALLNIFQMQNDFQNEMKTQAWNKRKSEVTNLS